MQRFMIKHKFRLNPYCTGTDSLSILCMGLIKDSVLSLNPYCTGTDSLSCTKPLLTSTKSISLNPYCTGTDSLSWKKVNTLQKFAEVLILIVLEQTL